MLILWPGVADSAIRKANLKRKAARVTSLLQVRVQAYTGAMRRPSLTDSIAHLAVLLSPPPLSTEEAVMV
jgi:hypothetical protein